MTGNLDGRGAPSARLATVALCFFAVTGCRVAVEAGAPRGDGADCFAHAPLKGIYRPEPSYSGLTQGFFSSGLVLADINGDHLRDLVVANGNDLVVQPLSVSFASRAQIFPPKPSWQGEHFAHHMYLAAGDVGDSRSPADGALDVAAAVLCGRECDVQGGGLVLYRNASGRLEREPSVAISGFAGTAVAFGDIDADGDLDIAAAAAFEAPGKIGGKTALRPGKTRVFLNRGGQFGPAPDWISPVPTMAFDVQMADVDQDGWLDLVVGGTQIQVFWGHAPSPGEAVPLSPDPWQSAPGSEDRVSFIDVAAIGPGPGLGIVASNGCFSSACQGSFQAFAPRPDGGGTTPIWTSQEVDFPSHVRLADLDGDGVVDLLAGQWGEGEAGGALWAFRGQRGDTPFGVMPDFVSCTSSVIQQIDTADILGVNVQRRSFTAAAQTRRGVVTLPARPLHSVASVSKNGVALAREGYTWAPSESWISFAGGIAPGDTVVVEYDVSSTQDIAVANFNNYAPAIGNFVYASFAR